MQKIDKMKLRQNRKDIVDRICKLTGIPKKEQTEGYFSRRQLLELVSFLERVTRHEPDGSECN